MNTVSAIVCTHNPRRDYLQRVLDALRTQTLPKEHWELLVIDNLSSRPLAGEWDLAWHPSARHIREDELGLTPARLRGIAEAKGDLFVFIDDDNILEDDFLETAQDIGKIYPFLGAWGGSIIAEFEVPPPKWTQLHWPYLAIREFGIIRWSNTVDDWQAQPCGAGLCVRARVAQYYAREVVANPIRRKLDRKGERLTSAGDTDLVYTSRELGLGWGTFPSLKLKHLIPKERLAEPYLLKLAEDTAESITAYRICRGESIVLTAHWKVVIRFFYILLTNGLREARFYLARKRGTAEGLWSTTEDA
jgi:glycosyltransferase involved in cell wall biosynthesis